LALGIEVDPQSGRADTGSLELDLSELAFDLAGSAANLGTGVIVLIDEMQDLQRDELAAICTAVHETGQRTLPFYVVVAGLPSLPGVLAEARSYSERLFAFRPIDSEGPSSSGEIARRLGKSRVQQVGPTRAKLIHKGLLYAPEHGLIAYTVPGMSAFISRQVD
jgi:hypothetical protein